MLDARKASHVVERVSWAQTIRYWALLTISVMIQDKLHSGGSGAPDAKGVHD